MNIQEMITYVQIYIHIRKNKEVDISINDHRDLMLLNKAYIIAKNWMYNNNVQIQRL